MQTNLPPLRVTHYACVHTKCGVRDGGLRGGGYLIYGEFPDQTLLVRFYGGFKLEGEGGFSRVCLFCVKPKLLILEEKRKDRGRNKSGLELIATRIIIRQSRCG